MNIIQVNHLNSQLIHFFIFVYLFLIFATVLTWYLDFRKNGKLKEIKLRIKSWWVISTLTIISIIIGKHGVVPFFAFVSLLGIHEYLKIVPQRDSDSAIKWSVYLALFGQYYFVATEWYNMFVVFIPVYVFLYLPIKMVTTGDVQDYLNATSKVYWGLMINVFCISHLAYLFLLPSLKTPGEYGAGLVAFIIFLTEINDVAQFLWGKMLGKHKVIPKVSPNKTWEGLIGGVSTTVIISVLLAPLLTPMTFPMSLFVGLVVGIMGFFGDISISAIKRDVGVKDSGTTLPGHGGILDRIDSITYTAVLFFHIMKYFYY